MVGESLHTGAGTEQFLHLDSRELNVSVFLCLFFNYQVECFDNAIKLKPVPSLASSLVKWELASATSEGPPEVKRDQAVEKRFAKERMGGKAYIYDTKLLERRDKSPEKRWNWKPLGCLRRPPPANSLLVWVTDERLCQKQKSAPGERGLTTCS